MTTKRLSKKKRLSLTRKDGFGRRIIETGEIVPLMVKKMHEGLAKCMQDNAHRREPYWILYTADWYRNGETLMDTFTPYGARPPRMLNTICWRVDNKIGQLKPVWVLPKDAPIEDFGETRQFDDTLIKSSQGIPIVY